jgi:hypothetical protein
MYGSHAMSLSDIGKACLFSKMSGVLLMDGKPVSGARIVRTVELSRKKEDETVSDENGEFELPAIFERSILNVLPQEFAAGQEVVVHYENKEYRIWSGVKREPEENSESRGKPLAVTCELNSERKFIQVNNNPIFTMCTWDVEPDIIDTGF